MKRKSLLVPTLSSLVLSGFILANPAYADENQATLPSADTSVFNSEADSSEATLLTTDDTNSDSSDEVTLNSEPVATAEEAISGDDTVTIIHTNDIHGRIEESSGVIGMAKLATVVEEARAEGTTLVLDAGDAFQGMPISNSTQGEDMASLMNQVGYDAMAVGNHEFDFSLETAKKYKEILNFPLLSANTYVNDVRLFEASTIVDKTPDVAGDEFVVIGVTTPETSTKTHPNNVNGVVFKDPITEVNNVISEIESKAKAEGKVYNNYIVLAHLGVDQTTPVEWQGTTLAEALATNPQLAGKKVIVIDGHSHTVKSATYGDNVTYNQTGSYLNNIGRITLNSERVLSAGVISADELQNVVPNVEISEQVAAIKAKFDAENAKVVIENNPVELNGDRSNVRVRETNLGNAVADALFEYGQTGFSHPSNLAVTNGGGLRATIAKDKPITKGDLIAVLPFGNIISQIEVNGQTIHDMFVKSVGSILQTNENGEPVLDENGQPLLEASGGFLHTSGAIVFYDTNLDPAERVLDIFIYDHETDSYLPLDLGKTYYLATNDFLAAGGDGYTMLGGAREEGPSMDTVFADYLTRVADLTIYEEINPAERLISVDSRSDLDGDGFSDYIEWLYDTDPENPNSYPGAVEEEVSDKEKVETLPAQTTPARTADSSSPTGAKPNAELPRTNSKESSLGMLGFLIAGLGLLGFRRKSDNQ